MWSGEGMCRGRGRDLGTVKKKPGSRRKCEGSFLATLKTEMGCGVMLGAGQKQGRYHEGGRGGEWC